MPVPPRVLAGYPNRFSAILRVIQFCTGVGLSAHRIFFISPMLVIVFPVRCTVFFTKVIDSKVLKNVIIGIFHMSDLSINIYKLLRFNMHKDIAQEMR